VALLPGRGFVVNPTVEEMEGSTLDMVIAGTSEAVLMIEGFCDFLSDEQMLEVRRGGRLSSAGGAGGTVRNHCEASSTAVWRGCWFYTSQHPPQRAEELVLCLLHNVAPQ
jgi:hypothetical protein